MSHRQRAREANPARVKFAGYHYSPFSRETRFPAKSHRLALKNSARGYVTQRVCQCWKRTNVCDRRVGKGRSERNLMPIKSVAYGGALDKGE
ncbi:hypothetical protein EVAR_3318_1 [Eumeta japonica]|uniref:Uncharacterized protein n=1 Tax=Eumeta variegata TaxID=151549 RepID=A0A4C1SY44_EUMVA|nr:hypothetical protein EVAR_3318_1 [Eumeta japonica]